MNILHHKSWHVRNKDNIERVRKDEEKADNEEKERLRRVALAEQEARTELLRNRSRQRFIAEGGQEVAKVKQDGESTGTAGSSELIAFEPASGKQDVELHTSGGHLNFFKELEDGKPSRTGGNKEYEAEKKAEQEEAEKKIGILTYLGGSSLEAQTDKPWYLKSDASKEEEEKDITKDVEKKRKREFDTRKKASLDPMRDMMKYMETKAKVEAQHQDKSSDKAAPSRAASARKRRTIKN